MSGRLVAVILLLLVAVPLVVVAVLSGSGEGGDLKLERTDQGLVVYIRDRALNRPATAGGKRTVRLECFDSSDSVVYRAKTPWPLPDTDAGQLPSHAHQAVPEDRLGAIARCRLAGTKGPLEGDVSAR